jgi:hypothetical protein
MVHGIVSIVVLVFLQRRIGVPDWSPPLRLGFREKLQHRLERIRSAFGAKLEFHVALVTPVESTFSSPSNMPAGVWRARLRCGVSSAPRTGTIKS